MGAHGLTIVIVKYLRLDPCNYYHNTTLLVPDGQGCITKLYTSFNSTWP